MYAVIVTGGKQHRVTQGETLKVEKIAADEGSEIELDKVLMIADGDNITIGAPELDKGAVKAKIIAHGRHKKVEIVKFRRRKHHRKQMGHRQSYTEIEVTSINA